MRHRNISKAATALGMTQPAVSNALARLRHRFGDPLFIRESHGVVPTQFANDIADDIEHHVERLKLLTQTQSKKVVDLSTIKRRFKIIAQDMEECLILPALVGRVAKVAPHMQLEIRPYNRITFSHEIHTNQADIVFAYLRDIYKNLNSKKLLLQDFVCVSRGANKNISLELTLEEYISAPHLIVSPDKGGFRGVVDEKLKELGCSRKVAVSVPHFLTGCQYIASNDYLLTLPRHVAEQASLAFNLKLHELPFELDGFSTSMHWHKRLDMDDEHKAIRDLIVDVVADKFIHKNTAV
jgi:DNA-binding transcriptional LysR family regulator